MTGPAPGAVVVVGGGVAGAAVALHALEVGAEVTVVDPGPGGDGPEGPATGASAGMLAPQLEEEHPTPLFELGVRSREMHPAFVRRLEELSGRRLGHRARGILVPAFEPHEERRARERARWQRERGLRAEVLDPGAARELGTPLPPGARSALWLPDEAWLDTQRLARALPAALEAAGARLVATAARGVASRGGAVEGVELEGGRRLEARCVVVAAGAWSGRLGGLTSPPPIHPARGQMLRYPAGALELERPVANHGGRYLVPREDGTVLAGSTVEAAGFDASTTPAGRRAVRLAAERLAPALSGVEPVEAWAGLRPSTPDELPVLGPDPGLEGLHWAAGYGRNGILLAPAAGRAVARRALEGAADVDLAPFRPGRFREAGGGVAGAGGGPAPGPGR